MDPNKVEEIQSAIEKNIEWLTSNQDKKQSPDYITLYEQTVELRSILEASVSGVGGEVDEVIVDSTGDVDAVGVTDVEPSTDLIGDAFGNDFNSQINTEMQEPPADLREEHYEGYDETDVSKNIELKVEENVKDVKNFVEQYIYDIKEKHNTDKLTHAIGDEIGEKVFDVVTPVVKHIGRPAMDIFIIGMLTAPSTTSKAFSVIPVVGKPISKFLTTQIKKLPAIVKATLIVSSMNNLGITNFLQKGIDSISKFGIIDKEITDLINGIIDGTVKRVDVKSPLLDIYNSFKAGEWKQDLKDSIDFSKEIDEKNKRIDEEGKRFYEKAIVRNPFSKNYLEDEDVIFPNLFQRDVESRAFGGDINPETDYLVGEDGKNELAIYEDGSMEELGVNGPEVIRPLKDGMVIPHHKLPEEFKNNPIITRRKSLTDLIAEVTATLPA